MDVLVRRESTENGRWGFKESFHVYRYGGKGYIQVTCVVTPDGELSKPYILRRGKYVEAEVIEKEMGVSKYLKAKKPFYSLLTNGFIADIQAGYNFDEKIFLPEETRYSVYTASYIKPISNEVFHDMIDDMNVLSLKRVYEVNDSLDKLMFSLAEKVVETEGNREAFIKSRF